MMTGRKLRDRWETESYVGWRAGQIEDPVNKLSYLRRKMEDRPVRSRRPLWLRPLSGAVIVTAIVLLLPAHGVVSDVSPHVARVHQFPERQGVTSPQSFRDVWLVDENPAFDSYSNGLRIDNSYLVAGQKRFYQVLERQNEFQPSEEWRSQPAGIVFHSTESNQAPFAAEQNGNLKRISNALLEHVRDKQAYNFVIDRFGRVFRVVEETSAANHAGNSVWGDEQASYVNLNHSFLGVAFEALSEGSRLSEAQLHAGRTLTDYLRAKFKIPTNNCITHAQVSVNPSNMLIGYHTDWAHDFPFEQLRLPDNYTLPVPSIADFGFEYDSAFEKAMGSGPWRGIAAAEGRIAKSALQQGTTLGAYRSSIQERYKRLYSKLKLTGALDEGSMASVTLPAQ